MSEARNGIFMNMKPCIINLPAEPGLRGVGAAEGGLRLPVADTTLFASPSLSFFPMNARSRSNIN